MFAPGRLRRVVRMADDDRLLGRGIYDVAEVARLVRRSVDEVARWALPAGNRDALMFPRDKRLLSFYDLVTAFVTSELRGRDVPLPKIRDARRYLASRYDVAWPLAHAASLKLLASVGKDVYFDAGSHWVDASQGGQGAFQEIVVPLVQRLEFDDDSGMASLWHPAPGVLVNPRVQAGAPCVDGTRVSTELLADLAAAGEAPDDIARDYALDPAVVHEALAFERGLAA
jgi:uncharacterized protein (DUF433 family)